MQIVTPVGECLRDCQKLLIMSIIVQLRSDEGVGVKSDGMDLIVGASDGEDGSNGVVGGVSFNGDWSIQGPVNQHRGRGEHILEVEEVLQSLSSA